MGEGLGLTVSDLWFRGWGLGAKGKMAHKVKVSAYNWPSVIDSTLLI